MSLSNKLPVPHFQGPTPQLFGDSSFIPAGASRRRRALTPAALPLQFPSLDHFRIEVDAVLGSAVSVQGLQPQTVARWVTAVRSFTRFLGTDQQFEHFRQGNVHEQLQVIDGWVSSLRMRTRPLSHVSVVTYWRSMDAVCRRLAARCGAVNPFEYAEPPRAQASLPRYLTRNNAQMVLQWVAQRRWRTAYEARRNTAVIGCMLLAGLRRQEVLRLNVDDVRDDEGTILIRRGKGRHGGRDRMAYMTPQLRGILRAYGTERRRRRPVGEAYFLSDAHDAPLTVITIRRLFVRISRAVGSRVTPHMLRHTYATLLRQAGVPDRVSMDLLGHRSIAMLQRYSHVVDGEHLQEAARLRLDVDLG